VVTASKVAIAEAGTDLLARAAARGVELRFEAAVGGGIPLLGPLEEDLAANAVSGVRGIVNGTTNYILGRMAQAGLPFAEALGEAQRLGYAEPDPTADIEGGDAACKLAILARLAFGAPVAPDVVYREGISRLAPRDLAYARELGYVVKLLAIGRLRGDDGAGPRSLELRVHPVFLPAASPLSKVDGALNAVEVSGDLVGSVVLHGPGAGGKPTASSVLGDVLAVARRRLAGTAALPRYGHPGGGISAVLPMGEVRSRYYLRLQVLDRPGVFAQVTLPLGDRGISLAQVIQRGREPGEAAPSSSGGGAAEIVLLTYEAREADMQAAVRTLATLPAVHEVSALVRVE
jgi:homoserine dehydrogenase